MQRGSLVNGLSGVLSDWVGYLTRARFRTTCKLILPIPAPPLHYSKG